MRVPGPAEMGGSFSCPVVPQETEFIRLYVVSRWDGKQRAAAPGCLAAAACPPRQLPTLPARRAGVTLVPALLPLPSISCLATEEMLIKGGRQGVL